jgi:glycerol transport system ATP-binding protein
VLGREGASVIVTGVEDIGRSKIVHARLDGLDVRIVLEEDAEIPAEPRVAFPPQRVAVFENGWRVELHGDD